ncbi:MAG: type II toxin-antitoxin system PemK/MazF family toxin [Geminicoccaceae bacterium]
MSRSGRGSAGGVKGVVRRFEVYLVNFDPTVGSEIKKTRPCLVVSPDEMNPYIRTVIVAPMTTRDRAYPTRIECRFEGKSGQIVLDQLRTIDKSRLVRRLGVIPSEVQEAVLAGLNLLFAP